MVIWKSVNVTIKTKMWHVRKMCGKRYRGFILDYGDLPVGRFNRITDKFEPCDNPRGRAYAARNRLKYRQKHRPE